ncbi:MAG: hypothetical protein OXB91_07445 [Bryobacterales bacterium]|nr:hypothetical protein [Bryobacterales bacterium]
MDLTNLKSAVVGFDAANAAHSQAVDAQNMAKSNVTGAQAEFDKAHADLAQANAAVTAVNAEVVQAEKDRTAAYAQVLAEARALANQDDAAGNTSPAA